MATQISDTIPESFRTSPRCPGTASSFQYPGSSGERGSKPDTITDDFARKAMTRVHEPGAANKVESVRLFYLSVNLTIPLAVQVDVVDLKQINQLYDTIAMNSGKIEALLHD